MPESFPASSSSHDPVIPSHDPSESSASDRLPAEIAESVGTFMGSPSSCHQPPLPSPRDERFDRRLDVIKQLVAQVPGCYCEPLANDSIAHESVAREWLAQESATNHSTTNHAATRLLRSECEVPSTDEMSLSDKDPRSDDLLNEVEGVTESLTEDGWLSRVSTGWKQLDDLLPRGGLRRGSLVEWLGTSRGPGAHRATLGSGVGELTLRMAWKACGRQRALVVLDQTDWFYPPAAAAAGIELQRLVWLRVSDSSEAFWALDQALRCRAIGAVWFCFGAWDREVDGLWFRRWQLAAERGGGLGVFLRSAEQERRPSWSEVRWRITPCGTRSRDGIPCGSQHVTQLVTRLSGMERAFDVEPIRWR